MIDISNSFDMNHFIFILKLYISVFRNNIINQKKMGFFVKNGYKLSMVNLKYDCDLNI